MLLALACVTDPDTASPMDFAYQPPHLVIRCDDADPNTLDVTMSPRSEPLREATVTMPDYGVEHAMAPDDEGDFHVAFAYPRTLVTCLDAGDDWLRVAWRDAAGSDAYTACVVQRPTGAPCGP